jgi:molybdenum cofactor biosynthesis enzyme MoaA
MMSLRKRLVASWFHLRNCGRPHILSVETHLCDHCNLNCRSCTHLCPLVTEPTFNDLEEYVRDIRTLAGKLNVHTVYLMGGEPLLHPQVIDFMRVTREVYPRWRIVIITNGLLLLKMPESFWRAMCMYRVCLRWSVYPATRGQFEEICKCCKKYRVFFENGSIG